VATFLRAASIEIDEFVAHGVNVLVTSDPLADGVDGVLPLSLFAGWLIRLDLPAKSLDLDPYPQQGPHLVGELGVLENDDLLFVKCRLKEAREAYFLLDTGASYNAISLKLARALSSPDLLGGGISLRGGTAALEGHPTRMLTHLQIGALELPPDPMVAVDLSLASRYHQLVVSGLIGFPALRGLVLVVNYRDGVISMAPK
jgi:predicted aspartyl protease